MTKIGGSSCVGCIHGDLWLVHVQHAEWQSLLDRSPQLLHKKHSSNFQALKTQEHLCKHPDSWSKMGYDPQ